MGSNMTPNERMAERARILQSRQPSKLEKFFGKVCEDNKKAQERKVREAKIEILYRTMARETEMRKKHHYLDLILAADASYFRDYGYHFIPKSYMDKRIKESWT